MASIAPELPVLARDQAFEGLYRRYAKDVYHYALALLRNPADAEDVTQTTFMNAYRAYQRGAQIDKPQNWLIKIAHNVARTRYARASRRVKEVPLEDHVDQLAVPEDEKPNIEGVLRALGRLPFNQRAALVMRELEGRSYVEIADTLGVSVSAVETLIFRARRSLKLRASALRALTAVPLPHSLAGLFEGGGLIAGGGGAISGGFLLKAAVALVAGTLATGVGGDKADDPTAASEKPAATSLAPAQVSGPSVNADRALLGRTAVAKTRGNRHAKIGADRAPALVDTAQRSYVGLTSSSSTSAPSSTTSPVTAVSQVAAPVTTAVAAVQETVAAAVPTLPVQVPSLPSPPVEPPPPPKLP
jgi:RNA polymerase sigma factor (sigma-70 family)